MFCARSAARPRAKTRWAGPPLCAPGAERSSGTAPWRELAPNLLEGGGRCLEAGPANPRIFGGFLRERGWEYASVDRWRTGNPHDPR